MKLYDSNIRGQTYIERTRQIWYNIIVRIIHIICIIYKIKENVVISMNQRDYYKQKINKILPEFPDYIEDFIDTYYDNLSPLTLHRYLETYKNFLNWTIRETISDAELIKDVSLSIL